MKSIKQTYTISAPVAKVWQALTDAEVMTQWEASPAEMDPTTGGHFSLWGGDIHGTNTKVIPEKLLEQDWYGHDRPDRKYKVSFSFETKENTTIVTLIHKNIPDEDVEDMSNGWRDYYFDPIQNLLER